MQNSRIKKKLCGELYFNNNLSVIVECKMCHKEFGVYDKFLNHIFEEHFDCAEPATALEPKKCETARKQHFAQIYITNNFCIIIDCIMCAEHFKNFRCFLDHVFDKHAELTESSTQSEEFEEKMTDSFKYDNDDGDADDDDDTNNTDAQSIKIEYLQVEKIELYDSDTTDSVKALLAMNTDRVEEEQEDAVEEPQSPTLSTQTTTVNKELINLRKRKQYVNDELIRRYKCKICGFAFKEQYNLRSHELRHTSKKAFTCLHCKKAFFTRTELVSHERRHTGERPYVCTYCGAKFFTVGRLRHHERRHRNERPYKCEQCGKCFFDGAQLREHGVVHTQERNYTCDVCAQSFSRKKTLRTHMKLHLNELQYVCNICDMRFNQRPTLIWHVKSKHNVISNMTIHTLPDINSTSDISTCNRCALNFGNKAALLEHQRQIHAEVDTIATLEALEEVESETLTEYLT